MRQLFQIGHNSAVSVNAALGPIAAHGTVKRSALLGNKKLAMLYKLS